jgi:hypothetical protein
LRVFFAMEFCIEIVPGQEGLVAMLRSYPRAHPQAASRTDKAAFYRSLTTDLLNRYTLWRRGIWDFSSDETEARRMFNDYTSVLETKKGARKAPSAIGGPMRSQGGPFYLNVTFGWMLARNTAGANALEHGTGIDKSALWRRQTFINLLRLAAMVAPSDIESDVVYVIPGEYNFALTDTDLAHPDYAYLRQIQD